MKKAVLCLIVFGFCLHAAVERQNTITRAELRLHPLHEDIRSLEEETAQLECERDEFESPHNLFKLAAKAEYGHLKLPDLDKVAYSVAGSALTRELETVPVHRASPHTAIGVLSQRP